jgi:hypothetical protein
MCHVSVSVPLLDCVLNVLFVLFHPPSPFCVGFAEPR